MTASDAEGDDDVLVEDFETDVDDFVFDDDDWLEDLLGFLLPAQQNGCVEHKCSK